MKYMNLCQHDINIVKEDGSVLTVTPSGVVARVTTTRVPLGVTPEGVPLQVTEYGPVQGLPEPEPETLLIVSGIVAGRVTGRPDVFSPGELVRGPDGQPVGCRGLSQTL